MIDNKWSETFRLDSRGQRAGAVAVVVLLVLGVAWAVINRSNDSTPVVVALASTDSTTTTTASASTTTVPPVAVTSTTTTTADPQPIQAESPQISETVGRRIVEDMLDAMAAGEWEIAAKYLTSEAGLSMNVLEQLGSGNREESSVETGQRLAEYCATALCSSPYAIGVSEATTTARSFRVTFASTDGPVAGEITMFWFEGIVTMSSLSPLGDAAKSAEPIDVRVFGEPYSGDLTIVRYMATERLRDGERNWNSSAWTRRFDSRSDEMGVAGDTLMVGSPGGVVWSLTPDDERTYLAEESSVLGGAGFPGGVPTGFLIDDYETVRVVDPDGDREALLLDLSNRDESIYSVDPIDDRLLVLMGAGESYSIEIYQFDPATRSLGPLITRVEPEGVFGLAQLAPDGATIAATLDPTFYEPIRTVALLDALDGSVLGRWTPDSDDTIRSMDYDGRFIVAQLTAGGLFVVDTSDGTTRLVDTNVTIRFG